MKKIFRTPIITSIATALLLTACGTGVVGESSRTPKGNPNAFVLIEEYADLQCPGCKNAHGGIVAPILLQYGDQVRYEFKHFPLRTIHRYALDAAEGAECAADQGKFWEYIDIAFERQSDINHDNLLVFAEDLELDVDAFEKCWKSRSKKGIVMADYEEGRERGVSGTPSFFVNGEKVDRAGFDTLSAAIDQALGAGQPL